MSSDAKMRQKIFSTIFEKKIDIHYDNSNIWLTFDFQAVREILPDCGNLFDPINNFEIDNNEFEPPFNNLPEEGNQIKILTSTEILEDCWIFSAKDIGKATNKYLSRIESSSGEFVLSDWLFLIGDSLSEEMPTVFFDVNTNYQVFRKLQKLSDHKFSGVMAFLCGKTILEVPSVFNRDCVVRLDNANEFININFNDSNPEWSIFKSVLYDNLSRVEKANRLVKFFTIFDTIVQEFKISCSIHYERYNLNVLKKELDESFISLNEKVRNSVDNVKGELILIISMAFALSQFDFNWGDNTAKNIIIGVSLFLASIIYSYLISNDKSSLKALNKIVDDEKKRLAEVTIEKKYEGEKSQLIQNNADCLSENIKRHDSFLTFCLFSVWVPIGSLLIGIIVLCFS